MFQLGVLVATRGVVEFCKEHDIDMLRIVTRHLRGDWSDMDPEDQVANMMAIRTGGRIFGSYSFPAGKVWIITEASRESTTFLLPSEY